MIELLVKVALISIPAMLFLGPILHSILMKKAKDKYREGIPTGSRTEEELMELLRRIQCPFVKEIYYDEAGNVALKTKWGRHTLILREGIVNTNPQEFDYIYSSDKMIVERNALFQYILKEVNHGLPINAHKYYNRGSKLVRLYLWTPRVLWTCAFIALGVFMVRNLFDMAVYGVKNGHPKVYPDTTYGEAFDYYFNSGEWSSFISEDERTVVEFEGKVGKAGKESTVVFQFVYAEDGESFSAEYVEVDGLGMADWVAALCIVGVFEDYEKGIKGNDAEAVKTFMDYADEEGEEESDVEEEMASALLNQMAAEEASQEISSTTQEEKVVWENTYYRNGGPYFTLSINEITDTAVNFTMSCGASGYLAYCDLREYLAVITDDSTAVYVQDDWSMTLKFRENGTIIIEENGQFVSGVSVGGVYIPESSWQDNSYEYALPYSDSQYITESDLYGMTKTDCRIARNEIYARHGRIFSDEALQSYFEICSWYYGAIAPEEFNDTFLSDVERHNLEVILGYEATLSD